MDKDKQAMKVPGCDLSCHSYHQQASQNNRITRSFVNTQAHSSIAKATSEQDLGDFDKFYRDCLYDLTIHYSY